MVRFPNCKINLGLRVIGKREDGFHDIQTIFYPLPIKEALELTTNHKNAIRQFELHLSGLDVPCEWSGNLCYKAYQLIQKDFPSIGPVRMHLIKAIPIGAGLGGGSSDGAQALLLLKEVLELDIPPEKLMEYALQLGSDCPFFILNKPCFATGRGEQMKELELNLTGYYFVLVNPGVHIRTAWAFEKMELTGLTHKECLTRIISRPVEQWKNSLTNDFERPVFEEYASLKIIRDELYAAGAVYASLTGTGSCLYGIFPAKTDPGLQKLTDRYQVYNLKKNR